MTVHTTDITYNLDINSKHPIYRMLYERFTLVRFRPICVVPPTSTFKTFISKHCKNPLIPESYTPKRYKYNSRTNITKTFFNHHPYQTFYNEPTNELNSIIYLYSPSLQLFYTNRNYEFSVCVFRYVCIWFYVDSKIAATLVNVTLCFVVVCLCRTGSMHRKIYHFNLVLC